MDGLLLMADSIYNYNAMEVSSLKLSKKRLKENIFNCGLKYEHNA